MNPLMVVVAVGTCGAGVALVVHAQRITRHAGALGDVAAFIARCAAVALFTGAIAVVQPDVVIFGVTAAAATLLVLAHLQARTAQSDISRQVLRTYAVFFSCLLVTSLAFSVAQVILRYNHGVDGFTAFHELELALRTHHALVVGAIPPTPFASVALFALLMILLLVTRATLRRRLLHAVAGTSRAFMSVSTVVTLATSFTLLSGVADGRILERTVRIQSVLEELERTFYRAEEDIRQAIAHEVARQLLDDVDLADTLGAHYTAAIAAWVAIESARRPYDAPAPPGPQPWDPGPTGGPPPGSALGLDASRAHDPVAVQRTLDELMMPWYAAHEAIRVSSEDRDARSVPRTDDARSRAALATLTPTDAATLAREARAVANASCASLSAIESAAATTVALAGSAALDALADALPVVSPVEPLSAFLKELVDVLAMEPLVTALAPAVTAAIVHWTEAADLSHRVAHEASRLVALEPMQGARQQLERGPAALPSSAPVSAAAAEVEARIARGHAPSLGVLAGSSWQRLRASALGRLDAPDGMSQRRWMVLQRALERWEARTPALSLYAAENGPATSRSWEALFSSSLTFSEALVWGEFLTHEYPDGYRDSRDAIARNLERNLLAEPLLDEATGRPLTAAQMRSVLHEVATALRGEGIDGDLRGSVGLRMYADVVRPAEAALAGALAQESLQRLEVVYRIRVRCSLGVCTTTVSVASARPVAAMRGTR